MSDNTVVRLYHIEPGKPPRLMNTITATSKFKNFKYDLSTEEGRIAAAQDQADGWSQHQKGDYKIEVGKPDPTVLSRASDEILSAARNRHGVF